MQNSQNFIPFSSLLVSKPSITFSSLHVSKSIVNQWKKEYLQWKKDRKVKGTHIVQKVMKKCDMGLMDAYKLLQASFDC